MQKEERSREIFEDIPGYEKPPQVPLPDIKGNDIFYELKLRPNRSGRFLLGLIAYSTGFYSFFKKLPEGLDELSKTVDLRGANLWSPIISASLTLKDDERKLSPQQRAATLLVSAKELHNDLVSAKLPPDMLREQPLEMGQYPNLFSTHLIVENKKARIFKSTNTSQITILLAGQFFILECDQDGREFSYDYILNALEEIKKVYGQVNKAEINSPGILTAIQHVFQVRAFTRIKALEKNRSSLETLRHSFLTLCLDLDSFPETDADVAKIAHSQNYDNRWFNQSVQIVVFGNSKAAMICSFSAYLDGNVMMRGAAEIQKRAAKFLMSSKKDRHVNSINFRKLDWQIFPRQLERARASLRRILDDQQATFEIPDIGLNFYKKHNIPAVPLFTIALQETVNQLIHKGVLIQQFLTMTKYRYMDVTTAGITKKEVLDFLDYLNENNIDPKKAIDLLSVAIESQNQACRFERDHIPFHRLFSMYLVTKKIFPRMCASIITKIIMTLIRKLQNARYHDLREVVVSHPAIYPEISIVGRPGVRLPCVKYFGLHYQIFDNKIVITFMPGINFQLSNLEIVRVLEGNLKKINNIIILAKENA